MTMVIIGTQGLPVWVPPAPSKQVSLCSVPCCHVSRPSKSTFQSKSTLTKGKNGHQHPHFSSPELSAWDSFRVNTNTTAGFCIYLFFLSSAFKNVPCLLFPHRFSLMYQNVRFLRIVIFLSLGNCLCPVYSSFHGRVPVCNLEWFIMTVRLHLGQAQELAFLVAESPLSHRECDYTR